MEKTSPGQISDSERLESEVPVEEPTEEPVEGPVTLDKLHSLILRQNNAILLLTTKMASMTGNLDKLEKGQEISDKAIIEVAQRVGGGGGSSKGGDLLAQILPYLTQQRGPGPLEKIAMRSFLENMAFSTLTTRRIARKQFGDEYASMVKDMEAELSGGTGQESKPT